jgi:WD40 repeat protein
MQFAGFHASRFTPVSTDRVSRVAWSPDGRTLASCGLESTIWLWDVTTGHDRTGLQGHQTEVTGLVFTPDSQRLFSSSEDGGLRVWDVSASLNTGVTSGQCIRVLQGYTASLYDVAWSPDGKWLAAGGTDRQVTVHGVDDAAAPRINVAMMGGTPLLLVRQQLH